MDTPLEERRRLLVTVMSDWASRDEKHRLPFLGMDLPDLPHFIEEPEILPLLVYNIFHGFSANFSLKACPCSEWERMATIPASMGSLPVSSGMRAFVENNWLSRTEAVVTLVDRLGAFLVSFPLLFLTLPEKSTLSSSLIIGKLLTFVTPAAHVMVRFST
jgi:hypothetical protein